MRVAVGIDYVIVYGELLLEDREHTGALPAYYGGRFTRRTVRRGANRTGLADQSPANEWDPSRWRLRRYGRVRILLSSSGMGRAP